jgi:hypothetical protein
MGSNKTNLSGVLPELAMRASSEFGDIPLVECGIGALMPWADRLWAVTYVAHGPTTGDGTGLYSIDGDLNIEKHPESVVGTYANRMVHEPTDQAIIGPHIIDAAGNVRTFDQLLEGVYEPAEGDDGIETRLAKRLTASMVHLEDPENKVYFLTMEGMLFEADVHTLDVNKLFDLNEELDIPNSFSDMYFKGGVMSRGRVVVANNSYKEIERNGERSAGRLAEWDGEEWTIIDDNPYMHVARGDNAVDPEASHTFAIGWDNASALLRLLTDDGWKTYRLPKGTRAEDHYAAPEWTRVREVEHSRLLMDCHGLFYELDRHGYGDEIWEISPIARHLRVVPDFCSYAGLLVLGGFQNTGRNPNGQAQSGLWFGKTDDLWDWGKPQGRGGPWWEDEVDAGVPSDPYLIRGFDEKLLHLSTEERGVAFTVEVDFRGDETWEPYDAVSTGEDGYAAYEFPSAFSAQWVRLTPDSDCTVTSQFYYE